MGDSFLLGAIACLACVMVGALIGLLAAYALWFRDPEDPETVEVPDYVPDGWGSYGSGSLPPSRPDAGGSP